ncbi:MAG: hypothetical protein GX069_09350, partial [Tissierellia bacterium]|nr:hypothetical protein [Tissierellia bacterium]
MRGKDNRINYIIFALICLIAFNVGSLLISWAEARTLNDEVKEVFNQEYYEEDGGLLISLLSRTSSIINLYRNELYKDLEKSFSLDNIFKNIINRFIRTQFPA